MENIGRFQLFRKNAFWSYLGEIIPRIGGLVVVPIWSSRIQPAEFAKWILALGGVEMLLTLTGQVFGTFFMKTLYRFHDEKGEKYFGMGAMATMISTAFIAVIVFFSAEKLSDIWIGEPGYGVLLKIMAGYLIFSQFSRLVRLYLQYKVRFVQLFWVNLVLWASNIGIMLFFYWYLRKGISAGRWRRSDPK
jgi:O-antigen/teichoic acid export membrane protein